MSVMTPEQYMQRGVVNYGNVTIERIDPRLLSDEKFYIFNVYSNEYTINLGTCGLWVIPGCTEGEEYVRAPQTIPGTLEEIYPHFTESASFRSRAVPSDDIITAILGTDRPAEDITKFGIFVSKHETPTKPEIVAAKKKLIPQLQKLIADADKLYSSPNGLERQSAYDNKYFRAAQFLNVKKPWLSEAAEMTQCPFCMIAVSPRAVICSGCNQVIDQAGYDALKAQVAGAK